MKRCGAAICLTLPGILLAVISAVFGWYLFPIIIHGEIVKNIRLIDGSDTWNKWKEAPIPIYLTFYIHHVTNPDEVENGLKPTFQEKGPYAYRQKRRKVDISQEHGLNLVKYRELKTFFFEPTLSANNTENDLVNVPNIPFIGVLHAVQKQLPIEFIIGLVGNLVLQNETFIKRNVRVGELLFEGFDVTKYTNSLLSTRLPKTFSGGRFGLFKGKNGTAGEEWQVFTGYENPADFGRVKTWDGKSELHFWRRFSECDKVKGTDGSIFQPFLTKQSVITVYSADVCRSLSLTYSNDMEYRGIPGFRFKPPEWSFADGRVNSENQCFCLEEKLDNCPHAGVLPLESCTDAPVWNSPPYFLHSDSRYLAKSGLPPPNKEKHETFIDLEPATGLILRAHKRLQISIGVKPHRKVRAFTNLNADLDLFPILWADESAELDEILANDIKGKLLNPQEVVSTAKWALLILGIVLFFVGCGVFTVKYLINSDFTEISEKININSTKLSSTGSLEIHM